MEATRKKVRKNSLNMWAVINLIYRNSTDLWLNWQTDVIQLLQIQMILFGQRHLPFLHSTGCCFSCDSFILCVCTPGPQYFPSLFHKMCSVHAWIETMDRDDCLIYFEAVLTHTRCPSHLVPHFVIYGAPHK